MKDLNALAAEVHAVAVDHGFWEGETSTEPSDRNPFEVMALVHEEVSEVIREIRKGFATDDLYFECKHGTGLSHQYLPGSKPGGIPAELADIILRVLDACGAWNVDIEKAMALKMEYNMNRPYRHGGMKA